MVAIPQGWGNAFHQLAQSGKAARPIINPMRRIDIDYYTQLIQGVPLLQVRQTTVSSGGTAQISLGPSGLGNTWYPVSATFSTTTGVSDGSFAGIYLGTVSQATLLNGQLYAGGGDTANLAVPSMGLGDLLVAEWAGAHAGDTATLQIRGSQDALNVVT